MNDRELLDLAAKAAVIEHTGPAFHKISTNSFIGLYVCDGSDIWNPITDDGDALRLAVKLGLWTQIGERCAWAQQNHESILGESAASSMVMFSETGNDPYAATRLAIVRAAAEIGKAMK